jgi:hypothetical protein
MAKRNDLKIQLELLEDIEKLEKKIAKRGEASYTQQKQLNALKSSSFKLASKELDLSSQIEKLQSSSLGAASKKLGLDKQITALQNAKEVGTKKELKNANKLSKIMADVASGNKDFSDALGEIAEEDFGKLNEAANDFADTLSEGGENLEKSVKRSKDLSDGFDSIKDTLGFIDLKKTFTMAGALAAITSFLGKALEVRQSLGTSAVESARLAGNMTAAGLAAKAVGGSSQEAEAAVTSLVDEFGSMSVVTAGVSTQLGLITGQFGLSGANAGKLLKSMQSINGASIETNLNLISSTGELARAEGVAPAQVLNDIAENTELFAQFAKDGGQNIAQAAIEARKLGLNLGTVASIAESLLDFESSIEKEMEASMLLGRQMSLDKARELALTGDLAGLAEEVKNQVGSQAEFEAMNVVQRKALADAIGVSVSDLGKMVAGEKTSVQIAEEKAKATRRQMSLEMGLAGITAIGAIPEIIKSFAKIPFGVGLPLAGAAIAGMYALMKSPPALEKGGVVKETGMAVVHKGEVFSGTRNEMGMGNGQTNKLLRELITQNEFLMNRLTNRVGDMALSN